MIDRAEAQRRVEDELRSLLTDVPDLVVRTDATIELRFGWVFFYDSLKHLETGDPLYAVAGNAPFIVNRYSGALVATGSAMPLEHYIREYEATLSPVGT